MWFDEETLTDCGRITGNPEAGEIFVVRDDFHKSPRFPSLTFVDLS